MSIIKGLIFDLDYTLYDESQYFFGVFEKFSEIHNLDFHQLKSLFSYELRIEGEDIFKYILEGINLFNRKFHEELFELYKTIDAKLSLYPDAQDILMFAKKNALKTAIITNGVIQVQKNKIRCLQIEENFDIIVYARGLGARYEKPHELPFITCLQQLGLNKDSVMFVGDDPKIDIIGAKKCHIGSVLLNRGHDKNTDHNADYEIEDLNELKQIIGDKNG